DTTSAATVRAMLSALRDDAELVKLMLPASVKRAGKLAYATRSVLGGLAAQTRQLEIAERLYRSALDLPRGQRNLEGEVYGGLLRVLRLQSKHQEIVDVCKKGLKVARATNRVLFHTEMARAYSYLDKHADAVAAADLAVKEAGEKEMLFCKRLRVDVLIAAGKNKRALAECQAMLKAYNHGSDLREVRAVMSLVYSATHKHAESEAQLQLILDDDPNDALANNNLGYHLADRNKDLDKAERLIRKAVDLDRQQRKTGTSFGTAEQDNAAYI